MVNVIELFVRVGKRDFYDYKLVHDSDEISTLTADFAEVVLFDVDQDDPVGNPELYAEILADVEVNEHPDIDDIPEDILKAAQDEFAEYML